MTIDITMTRQEAKMAARAVLYQIRKETRRRQKAEREGRTFVPTEGKRDLSLLKLETWRGAYAALSEALGGEN